MINLEKYFVFSEVVSINKILLVLFTFVYNRRNENNQETFL